MLLLNTRSVKLTAAVTPSTKRVSFIEEGLFSSTWPTILSGTEGAATSAHQINNEK